MHPLPIHSRSIQGFTIIELMVTLAILALLATVALPFAEHTIKRDKELQLRRALRDIRTALDAYKADADALKINKDAGASGYPATLAILASGVQTKDNSQTIYYLRRVPTDPFAADQTLPPDSMWGRRSYDTDPDSPHYTHDVFDVYSQSAETGLNGVPYKEW